MATEQHQDHTALYENTNGMPLSGGKTLHMELGVGDLANRIITVGSVSRAKIIASFFDSAECKCITSSRGFTTVTGTFNGVPVSVVAIGMGASMMDFFVRESCAVLRGKTAIVRFGTCGGISEESHAGTVVVASGGSGLITRNPDAFAYRYESESSAAAADPTVPPYRFSRVAPACPGLSQAVRDSLVAALGPDGVVEGVNVTADSFYSSQGRVDANFEDFNETVVHSIRDHYPSARSLEMESFVLLHLARCSRIPVSATAAAIVVSNRLSTHCVDAETLAARERVGARAVLEGLMKYEL